jgi:hypothetical protein
MQRCVMALEAAIFAGTRRWLRRRRACEWQAFWELSYLVVSLFYAASKVAERGFA